MWEESAFSCTASLSCVLTWSCQSQGWWWFSGLRVLRQARIQLRKGVGGCLAGRC